MPVKRLSRWWSLLCGRRGPARRPEGSAGFTFVELSIFMLIFGILIVSLVNALRVAARGPLVAKERLRGLSLAREKLEDVKNLGYGTLQVKFSNYYYPEYADLKNPLAQDSTKTPYPATAPNAADDPWTPETLLIGNTTYWRHVVVKFVSEPVSGGSMQQAPVQSPAPPCSPCGSPTTIGGNDTTSNLAYIEVDVTWFSRRLSRMQQIRVSTFVANIQVPSLNVGSISGTVYDDDNDRNYVDGGGTTAISIGPGADDKPITWASLVISARDEANGKTYSTTLKSDGSYLIKDLPNGSYYIDLKGGTQYDDSGYTGTTSEPGMFNDMMTVTIDDSNRFISPMSIWTLPTKLVTVYVCFKGVDGSVTPQVIEGDVSDGSSKTVTLTVTQTCDAASPCWFTVNNVAWPSSGLVRYRVSVNNTTADKQTTGTLWMDTAASGGPSDFVIGANPATMGFGGPWNNCGGSGSPPVGCTEPPAGVGSPPLDVTGTYSLSPVSINVLVREYYDLATKDLQGSDTQTGRVKLVIGSLYPAAGSTTTLSVDKNGSATFYGVVPTYSGDIKITAFMTTTGFSTDDYFLPFAVQPGHEYHLAEGAAGELNPDQQHTFVLSRVAGVSGTVWRVSGVTGFGGASVQIKNDSTQWSSVVKADGSGRFVHSAVPKELSAYLVQPLTGADYSSVPTNRFFTVNAHGVEYKADGSGGPMDFVLSAINGAIQGTVYKTATPNYAVREGAIVIASTYDTGASKFLDAIPDPVLNNDHTYSAVTLTDGTFKIKVATGVGAYWLYGSAVVNGVELYYKWATALAVPADTTITQDLTLP